MSSTTDTQEGTIKFFHDTQKYGFIKPNAGGKDIFFHISGVCQEDKEYIDGTAKDKPCTYTLSPGDRGPEAKNVAFTN